jgi:hypothetical protein
MMTPALPKIKAARQHGSRSALTILAPRRSREGGGRQRYEYQRGQFVTFTPDELKALDVESSEIIDLEKFVPRGEIDPVYFNSPYYLYPDGPIAVDTFKARTVTRPTPVIDLMTALKRSLAQDSPAPKRSRGRNRRRARHRCRKAAKAGLMLVLTSRSKCDSDRLR